jgi:predicted AlkP superfamily phosphohydrolase/phosphomutase
MRGSRRVIIVGLDGVPPELLFERWSRELPTFSRLARESLHGPLRSIDPPITVPAWTCMVTSKDPGQLGCYGFRNRVDHGYGPMRLADSTMVREPTLWRILSRKAMRSIIIGVPQTYPPQPLRGLLAAGFMAPDEKAQFTYPASLREELDRICGGYLIDVPSFRTQDRPTLLAAVQEMTRKRFQVARHLIRNQDWDFFMMVEMGPDRMHHGFWKCFDPSHPAHQPGNPHQEAMRDYYALLDEEMASLLDLLDPSDTLLVVSDHGARPMMGGLRINEWLRHKGYLRLQAEPREPTRFDISMVDWAKTMAWSEGGYYARVFLNVEGREPQGTIAPEDYEKFRRDLACQIREMQGPEGKPLHNRVLFPEELYRACRGVAPDLMVYLGDLDYRSIGTVGGGDLFTAENDTGPDDANHDPLGVYLLYEPWRDKGSVPLNREAHLLDVAPTVLDRLGLEPAQGMLGSIMRGEANPAGVRSLP